MYIIYIIHNIYKAHLASAECKHSFCHESFLTNFQTYLYIYTYIFTYIYYKY